ELREPVDGGSWHRESLGSDDLVLIRFDNFGLALDHEERGFLHRDHGERLERRIQSQTANDHANLRKLSCESRSTACPLALARQLIEVTRATRALLHFKRRRAGESTASPLLPDDEQVRRKVRVLPEGTRRQNTLQGALGQFGRQAQSVERGA